MTSFGKKLDKFYSRLGDRGIMAVLFALSALLNTVFALRMSAPLYPDEFGTAARSAFFAGFGHGGIGAEEIAGGGSGWLAGALYAPFYYLFGDPFMRYKSMLVLNGVIAAFIPVLAYKIAALLGSEKSWQKTLCAVVAGAGIAAFMHTKFIWSETLTVFVPFVLFWLFLKTTKIKSRALRQVISIILALICALSLAADSRMFIYAVVFILTALCARRFTGVKTIALTGFCIAFAAGTAAVVYLGNSLHTAMTGEAAGFELAFDFDIVGIFSALYYFAVSTWGIGVLGVCLCVNAIREHKKGGLLPIFAFFSLGASLLMIVFFPHERHIDGAVPLLIIFTLCYVFERGLDFRTVLYSIVALGVIFALFFIFADPDLAEAMPEVSATFCFAALLVVLVSCAERYRAHFVSLGAAVVILYSCVFAAAVELPAAIENAERQNARAYEISEYIYNSADAPPTYVMNAPPELTYTLRFLNRDARINIAEAETELSEDCFVIMPDMRGGFTFTIRGERAQAYVLSQAE